MKLPEVTSIRPIQMRYSTGEKPVLVECNDLHSYICKYLHSSFSAFKLVCELSGALFAQAWELKTPEVAFVKIRPADWLQREPIDFSAPSFGSQKLMGVMDVTPASIVAIKKNENVKRQLLKIALFDLWVANEDRNSNNANLLYDLVENALVAIDHGCILNTAEFDYSLSQLTCNETILASSLAHYLLDEESHDNLNKLLRELYGDYMVCVKRSLTQVDYVVRSIPGQWGVPKCVVEGKLKQLFEDGWIEECWESFVDYLNENGYV